MNSSADNFSADNFSAETPSAEWSSADPVSDPNVVGSEDTTRDVFVDDPSPSHDASEPEPMHQIGDQIGRVRILSRLGGGGMGEVYEGFDEALERRVAVKTIRSGRVGPDHQARFRREARMLSKLDHPNVCRVWDLFEDDAGDHLILELVDGKTLREAGDPGTAASPTAAERLDVAVQIAEALAAAHRLGIVHRDLKPDNIMLSGSRVKVLDFGLARRVDVDAAELPKAPKWMADSSAADLVPGSAEDAETSAAIAAASTADLDPARRTTGETAIVDGPTGARPTLAGQVLGTLYYMSPEQIAGAELTLASDLYSLGIVLQQFLTGRPAYPPALEAGALAVRVWHADTDPVRDVDADLAVLLEDLKQRDPARRPGAEEVVRRLRALREKPRRRRRRGLAFGALCATLLLLFFTAAHTRRSAREHSEEALALVREMKDMEWRMRVVHGFPLHDIRPQKEYVRERMAAIRDRLAGGDEWIRGPGHAALGRGHLILGEATEALAELEAAVAAGERGPSTLLALGLTRGEIYREELARARLQKNPELREIALERAESLRRGAVDALRSGRSEGSEALDEAGVGVWVEGMLALYEQRWDSARESASSAAEKVPWLYEAHLLRGEIEQAVAAEESDRGNLDLVRAALERAAESFEEAKRIGSSDPATHLGLCRLYAQTAWERHHAVGGDASAALEKARRACRDAAVVDQERREIGIALARVESFEAEILMSSDPARAIESARRGLQLAEALIDEDPEDGEAWLQRAASSWRLGKAIWLHGGDATQVFEDAVEAGRRAVQIREDFESRLLLGLAALEYGNWLDAYSHDASEALGTARESFQRAIELRPQSPRAHFDLGLVYIVQASNMRRRGASADEAHAAAAGALGRAVELNPQDPGALRSRAILHLEIAEARMAEGADYWPACRSAFADIDEVAERFPGNVPIHMTVVQVYGVCLSAGGTREAGRTPADPAAWEFLERGLFLTQKALQHNGQSSYARWTYELLLEFEAERRRMEQMPLDGFLEEQRAFARSLDEETAAALLRAVAEEVD